jgi:hypothetical protein
MFCIALPAFGQITTIDFTSGYTTTWGNFSGDFGAGIYSATIDGLSSPGIICDDFNDEIVSGETWNATAIRASTLSSNLESTFFGGAIGLNGYAEVATLVSALFNDTPSLYGLSVTQAELSSAIWDITSGGTLLGPDGTAQELVGDLEQTANIPAEVTALAGDTNLWLLVPNPRSDYTGNAAGREPQEMWTSVQGATLLRSNISNVPEGGTALIYLLLAGATCFGAVYFNSRSRLGKSEAA